MASEASRPLTPVWVELTLRVVGSGGLGLWHMRPKELRRRRAQHGACAGCARRHRRLMIVFAVIAVLQAAGLTGLVSFGVGAPVCRPPDWFPAGDGAAYVRPDGSAAVRFRQVVTAGPTGLALIYAKARGAEVCRFAPNGGLIARMDGGFARGGTMWGHAFLTHPRSGLTYAELLPLKHHEARHTIQWTALTTLGGPATFPLSYAADEAIAPGPYNHFERQAGLADGNYPDPDGPSPATSRALIAAAVIGVAWFEHHRLRRQLRILVSFVRHPGTRTSDRQFGCRGCGMARPG